MPLVINCQAMQARPLLADLAQSRLQVHELTFSGADLALYFGPVPSNASTRTAETASKTAV